MSAAEEPHPSTDGGGEAAAAVCAASLCQKNELYPVFLKEGDYRRAGVRVSCFPFQYGSIHFEIDWVPLRPHSTLPIVKVFEFGLVQFISY